jgi:ACR3 family arsenite efflux pump ArsB/nucleotide-binding universal stress UspA family protein
MWKLLTILQKNLVWSIPISMLAGLYYGVRFDSTPLKLAIIPVTFIMVYPMMATLNVRGVFKGRDTKLQVTTQVINFVLIPLIAYGIGKLFFASGAEKYGLWAVGLFLIGVLPTSGMTISWTGFARGNKEAAIKMVVFGLVLGALAAPLYTRVFMGATVDVDMLHMFQQISLFVFVPLSMGLLTQYLLINRYGTQAWNKDIKPKFPPFSALGVTLIAFVAMALKAKNIFAKPGDLVAILAPLAVFYLVTYLLLSLIGRLFFKREDAIAMVFGVVMRDLSIALAIAMTAFGQQGLTIALLIALAYVIQIQSAAWFLRLVDLIFTTTEERNTGERKPRPRDTLAEGEMGLIADATAGQPPFPSVSQPAVPTLNRILLATDLSPSARYAALHACSLGNQYRAMVTVMHVIPDTVELLSSEAGLDLADLVDDNERQRLHRNGIAEARQRLAKRIEETAAKVAWQTPDCSLSADNIRVSIGDPAAEIVAAADRGHYDLIIMGSHGHGRLEETMIGSVTQAVIHQSRRPVLVVRLPADHLFAEQTAEQSSTTRRSALQ